MRILPRSLAGQLVLLMLGGFILGNLFGALGLWRESGVLHPIARDHALSRTVTAYRLALREPPHADGWLDAFNNNVARLWIDEAPSPPGTTARELALASDLRQRLPTSAVSVHMPCRDDDSTRKLDPAVRNSNSGLECVEINMALAGGRWLHTRQALPVQSLWRDSWHLLRLSLLVGIPPVLILLYVFINRILRPTTVLTDAADRMSRGERLDPLALQGPDEIREIARAFNDMHQRTTRFVDERTRMLAAISHDLRTPLTSLELQVAMLPDSEERTELLRTLGEVREMVNETLRFATRHAQSEPSNEVELGALLKEVCSRHRIMGHAITPEVTNELTYRCRPLAIRRALDNLIVNAVRHGQHVSVRLTNRGAEGVCIDITDDGPGIPEELLERVFEPFFQLDEARHRESGSNVGLGLATARDCVQAHGGHISLHNRAEGGLHARIVLPPAQGRAAH